MCASSQSTSCEDESPQHGGRVTVREVLTELRTRCTCHQWLEVEKAIKHHFHEYQRLGLQRFGTTQKNNQQRMWRKCKQCLVELVGAGVIREAVVCARMRSRGEKADGRRQEAHHVIQPQKAYEDSTGVTLPSQRAVKDDEDRWRPEIATTDHREASCMNALMALRG